MGEMSEEEICCFALVGWLVGVRERDLFHFFFGFKGWAR